MVALAHTAATFATRSWDVVLDGIFGPWFLPTIAAELRPTRLAVEYAVLRAPLEATLARVRARSGHGRDHVVRQMHGQFAQLGAYERHVVDAADRGPADLLADVTRRRAAGAFLLDLA